MKEITIKIILTIIPIILLIIFSCGQNIFNIPFTEKEGKGILSVQTDKKVYSWQYSDSKCFIIIQGTLINNYDTTYYANLGDSFGPYEQDQLQIARNSAGYIEKYNESDNLWQEIDITLFIIEGSRFVPIQPLKNYTIYSHLSLNKIMKKKGNSE